jgi:hypothetical protein
MEPSRERFLRSVAVGALAVVGTLIFAALYLLTGTVSLDNGVWPVFAGGACSSAVFLVAALGGSALMERLRKENEFASRNAKSLGYGLWLLFLGSGFLGVLFAGLFAPIGVSFTVWSIAGQLLLSAVNGLLFTLGGTVLMFLLEQLIDQ